ncbi:MAG: M35 family metallo-endopeptidase [Spongiibacteraceae bacterium]
MKAKKLELEKWDETAQKNFKTAFGATDETSRNTISKRIDKMLELNKGMSLKNFKHATPENSSPGLFAYVYPNDKDHTIYLGDQFWKSSPSGIDSTGGNALSRNVPL